MAPFVLTFLLSLAFCYATYSPIPPRVNVRWREDVTLSQRVALEAAYRLAEPAYDSGTTWSYGLLDTSTDNIQRLVQDPAADDTHMIDRGTFELTEPPPERLIVLFRFLGLSSIVGVIVASFFVWGALLRPRARRWWRAYLGPRSSVDSIAAPFLSRWSLLVNFALVVAAVGLFAIVDVADQPIATNGGFGSVGLSYKEMLEGGWARGETNPALRPMVVWLNGAAYAALAGDVIAAFVVMNYLYVGLLAFAVCLLFDRYSRDTAAKTLMVVNLFLCIATVKFVSYYPVIIDAGAYALLTLAVLAIVSGKRILAAVCCSAAVLGREFGIAAVLFGIHRDVRQGVPPLRIAGTYAPAILIFLGWRAIVSQQMAGTGSEELVSVARLLRNLAYWREPAFALFFSYFLLTVFGGVSLFVAARSPDVWRRCREEREWVTFGLFVVGVAAMGDLDLWRYLAYLLPLFVMAFAVSAQVLELPLRRWALAVIVCVATLLTQRPFQQMSTATYFRDWFPYYVLDGQVQFELVPPLWDVWLWRLLGTAVLGVIVATWFRPTRQPDMARAGGQAPQAG